MPALEPRVTRPVDASVWSPPLPEAPGFDHLVVETRGLRTHVATIGEGEPVVLLHGFPEHWWQWHAIAPVIAERGYRVICPDLRGAGWTVADDPRVDRQTRLRDLLALFDVLEVERAHVVSHDLGVLTAANELGLAANTGLGHGGIGPGRVAAIIPVEGNASAELLVAGTTTRANASVCDAHVVAAAGEEPRHTRQFFLERT